ncbi:uncharacterized protein LOC121730449 [Aricia agestis]|uniref:uncharacterized protein LOC121730449 n=1 Tax=Aricia agestis TaxID=91739 RepID=UPI001C20AD3B|nr:uncharacterized protein LOC121730449 [Aricia agestis]
MAATAGPRKTISVHDYPEHLNPFRDEDNHNKIRFWTIGRKLNRSNSINFSGIKDLRNSWSLRSFMRKGKKGEPPSKENDYPKKSPTLANGDNSPIVYRRALQYSSGSRNTVGSPEQGDRYVYGGSITPLPRSRFQERLRSSHQEVNSGSNTPRMARSEITGSRLSIESTNPFDEPPIPPVRASRRKKKRAPPPPPVVDETINDTIEELRVTEAEDKKAPDTVEDDNIEDVNLNIELKIVEDKDEAPSNEKIEETTTAKVPDKVPVDTPIHNEETVELRIKANEEQDDNGNDLRNADSEDNLIDKSAFPKINIEKYRRNSSVNEDDIKLRRGNLEDFHSLSSKRSQSLINTSDERYVAFDINLNESKNFDINSNEEPQRVVCKVYEETRKKSLDNSISSTEKEFLEIDRATRELEKEISKLNTALHEDDLEEHRLSVSEIRRKFDIRDTSPNPIPKPRRSHYGESQLNGNV